MSRSYRHFPMWKSEKSCKWAKTYANRKVRRSKQELSNGNCYRRLSERWDFYEYKSYKTKQDAIDDWYFDESEINSGLSSWKSRYHGTLQEAINDWKKSYLCK